MELSAPVPFAVLVCACAVHPRISRATDPTLGVNAFMFFIMNVRSEPFVFVAKSLREFAATGQADWTQRRYGEADENLIVFPGSNQLGGSAKSRMALVSEGHGDGTEKAGSALAHVTRKVPAP